jgi:DNA-binding XRE family transcriptional regulator
MKSAYDRRTGLRTTVDGGKLKELRISQDMSGAVAAQRAGIAQATLHAIEAERAVPTTETIAALRSLYGDALARSGAVVVGA